MKPHREWVAGRLTGVRGDSVKIIPDLRFTELSAAELAIFRRRSAKRSS